MTRRHPNLHLWLHYTLLAALILGPLLLPGYVLTFDMSWTPHLPVASVGDNSWPFFAFLKALNIVIPSMALQKLLLLGLFVMAGVGAHKLARPPAGQWAAYLAGILYAVNPFTYTRLMAGQYLVLAGYALLPWFVRALLRLLEQPGWRRAVALVAWAAVIGAVSIHSVGFLALLFITVVLAWAWGRWRQLWATAGWLALVVGAWIVASAYWLVPLVLDRSSAARAIAGFDPSQFAAYATSGRGGGVPLAVLSLQGFWGDTQGQYVLASATGALFWLAFAALMALVIIGLWRGFRTRDRLGVALAIAGFIAWLLAMGIAWAPAAGLTHWLVAHVPFYRGYREPQKWAAVLALAYAYLGALGLRQLRDWLRGWPREAATIVALLVPLALAPMLLWGAGGQLRSVAYPAGWYDLNRRLSALPPGGVVLFPWHEYLVLDFAGRLVANPAPGFFDRPLISSDDPELIGVMPPSGHPASRVVENDVLAGRFFEHNAGSKLAPLGIHYIALLKQADWTDYDWLNHQTDLKLIAKSDSWRLYRVEVAK
jgi:hypothetical protein